MLHWADVNKLQKAPSELCGVFTTPGIRGGGLHKTTVTHTGSTEHNIWTYILKAIHIGTQKTSYFRVINHAVNHKKV